MTSKRDINISLTTDKALLEQVITHDAYAYQQLYKRYAKPVYMFIFYRTEDKAATEDLVQEIFMEVWEKSKEIQEKTGDNVKKWFFSRADSLAAGYLKKQRRMVRLDDLTSEQDEELTTVSGILDEISYNELKALIDNAVKALPVHLQKIYMLRIKYRYNVEETARMLSLAPNTVYKNHSEALSQIRKYIESIRPDLSENIGINKKKLLAFRATLFFF